MFQEPFFLHPPGSRPRDGLYINPMSAFIGDGSGKANNNNSKDMQSFYLHNPHDLVYTRITHLFNGGTERSTSNNGNGHGEANVERKDETLTGKWHVPDITRR